MATAFSTRRDSANDCNCAFPKLSFERRFSKEGYWYRVDYCYQCQGVKRTREGKVKTEEEEKAAGMQGVE
jgi:hypothetical protein